MSLTQIWVKKTVFVQAVVRLSPKSFPVNLIFLEGMVRKLNMSEENPMVNVDIEELLPHRNGMKLIDSIIEVDKEGAVSKATVTGKWPLIEGDSINSIVLIELVAQTAGICLGWEEHKKKGGHIKGKGWLAGVKEALFYCESIPLDSQIMTEVKRVFDFENYHEVLGMIKVDGELVGKVSVQIVKLVPE